MSTATSRVRLGRVVLVAGAIEAVGLGVNAAITALAAGADSSLLRWLVPSVVAVAVAMAQAALGARPPRPDEPRPRGVPVAVAVVLVVTVFGLGGLAVATGARLAVEWATGNQPVVAQRLAAPAQGSAGALTASVTAVEETRDFTRVTATVVNTGSATADLPVFGFCRLVGGDATSLEADGFRSDWPISIPAGGIPVRGTIVFTGHLPDDVTTGTLVFTQVFGAGGGGSLAVTLSLSATPEG